MTDVLFALLFAAVLFLIGFWGRRNLTGLVPQTLSAHGRAKKERELRRGATALIGFATLIVIATLARSLFTLLAT